MRGMIFKSAFILTVTLLSGLQISAQPDVGQFFNNLKNRIIANADKLAGWKNDAESALRKTVRDFTDCPSPAAQNLYDDLKRKLEKAQETERLANEADRQAVEARENCKRTTRLNNQCDASYNSLSFRATAGAARATAESLQKAINALKAMKCPAGCDKTGRIVYPIIQSPIGMEIVKVPAPPLGPVPVPMVTEITYCSVWRRGEFWLNWDSGNGQFDADFHLRTPKCEKTDKIAVCTEWDLNLLLPRLKKLNIVPPDVSPFDFKVEVPNKNISVVSGVKQTNCNRPVKIAKRYSVTLNLELGSNPLQVLPKQGEDMVEVGCAEPAFGLEPISNNVSVPDLAKVRISWKGITVKGGYVEIDMTRPELQVACKKGFGSSIKVPTVNIGNGYLDLPYVCLKPRFVDLIGKK
ncbi:MAG: hypothetical protein JSS81_23950 [Acidobacteria bacterium]|nr:hypothetical protein [Acidobacteriota bacterium]